MAKTSSMYIRINPDDKANAEELFGKYGMSITDAINIFIHTSLLRGGLPFDLREPDYNNETLEAFKEVEQMKKDPSIGTTYKSVSEMMEDILA